MILHRRYSIRGVLGLAQTDWHRLGTGGLASSILLVTSTHHVNIISQHNVVKERYAQG